MFRVRIGQIALAFIVFGLLLTGLVMNFDFGVLRPTLERRLSASLGRQVRIGTLRRLDHGFHPTLRIEDLHVAQPGWAGPGDMLHIRSALVRLRLWPLLIGRVSPDSLDVDGLRLAFVRQDSTHANWRGLSSGHGGGGGGLRHIALRDAIVVLDDRKRDHRFAARVTADDRGFRLAGPGHLAGYPSHITLTGATLANPGPWPFRLDYRSAITNATLVGRADRPLDLGHFSAHATGWGNDLKSLDLLIEAGLPGTQPFRLAGDVVHTRPDWSIRGLTGSIGRSDVALSIEVKKRDGRTKLDGDFASNGLDFTDLASNAGLARAAAKRAAFGPRIFPDTAIHLEHMRRTDGVLRIDFRRLLFKQPSPMRSIKGVMTLDHGVLTAAPLTVQLASGRVTGTAQVRHPSGAPLFTADLRLTDARLEKVVHQDNLTGALTGRIRLAGYGRTIREAAGRSTGSIALVVRNGTIGRRAALFLGADAGRALFEEGEATTGLHCLIARIDARKGEARPAPILIDTDVARINVEGLFDLSNERMLLSITGHPKLAHAVQIDHPIQIGGTILEPKLTPPAIPKTVGTVFRMIGNAIAGKRAEPVPDLDCAALAAQALR
jgi:uncharacterized protein involved in outer membrane biogenesis